MTRKRSSVRLWLTLFFTSLILIAVVTNTILVSWLLITLSVNDIWFFAGTSTMQAWQLILVQVLISLPVGFIIAVCVTNSPLQPLRVLIESMHALADGRFGTRLSPQGILWKYPAYKELSDSFNTLAEELEDTEMLRSDFINNFSHEFKTPIVSIAGFAKLLQKGNLPEAQRQEYLEIIESESRRLSYMATNVLNLTKIENQAILTDLSTFNLAEQIRDSILLLSNKWEEKELDLRLEMDELTIQANEELLKQVWINLVHNAIKFTPEGGIVEIAMQDLGDQISVSITNHGSQIPPEAMDRIFNKFYQADESHATEGNGVGLAIVKRVTTLHNGTVTVASENNVTSFTVKLPKQQK